MLVVPGAGDDDHAPVHAEHVDVVAVEPLSTSERTTSSVGAAGRATGREVDDPVHHRQQRVHLVGRDQHRDLLLGGDPRQQLDDLLGAAQVEVGQRLVEQQQPRPADQRVRDQDPLLLAARQPSRRARRRTRARRRRRPSPARARGARARAAASRAAARRARARSGRGRAAACRGRAGTSAGRTRRRVPSAVPPPTRTLPEAGACRPRITRNSVVLPAPFGADQPGELAGPDREADVIEHRPAAEADA